MICKFEVADSVQSPSCQTCFSMYFCESVSFKHDNDDLSMTHWLSVD